MRSLLPLLVASLVACGSAGPTGSSATDAGHEAAAHEASAPDVQAVPHDYGSDGPAAVTVTSLTVSVPGDAGATFALTAYLPGSAGPHPVVYLEAGFFQQAAGYAPYGQRLASWGIVALLRGDPGLAETSPQIASDISWVVTTWLPAANADATSPLHGRLDLTRVGLAGHSRGGQVTLLAAEGALLGKVKGVFGLDPVDTSVMGSPEARTAIASVGVPVAFAGETTDDGTNLPDAAGGMACAPAADNYEVLYAAAAPPAVALTFVNADHTMFEDPASCFACAACTPGTATATTVLSGAVRYLTAYFARELLGDAMVGAAFEGAGAGADVAAGAVGVESK